MDGMLFDHLDSLDKSRTNWRIKVRVTRMWTTYSPDDGSVKGYNLILLDDDNNHVHAYVYPHNWQAIGNNVVEGNVYIIQNFHVRDTIGKLKPVSTKHSVRLYGSTNIESVANDEMIPAHKFEFMDLGDLVEEGNKNTGVENPEFAVDLIGVIELYEKHQRITTRVGERDIVRFVLSDGSDGHKVTVWGDLAVTINNDYEQVTQKPVIAVMTSCKITIFRDAVQIGTLPSSKIYLNLKIDPVDDMRTRLEEEGYKSPLPVSTEITNVMASTSAVIEKLSFKELIDNAHSYFAKKNVIVAFTLTKVEDGDNWWYLSCTVCHEEVEKVEKKFKCIQCNRSFPYSEKRFRIFVLADDNTLACNVILTDRVVKRIAGTTATNLLNQIKKDASLNTMPAFINDMIGKKFTVKIRLSETNISGDSNIYEAVDLCDEIVQESNNKDKTPVSQSPSFNTATEIQGIELFQTPDSAKSVNKKVKTDKKGIKIK